LTSSARSTPNGSPLVTYTYDPAGNILSKSDYATLYHYQGAGPNAVSSVTLVGGGSATFSYDGNGNMTIGHNKTLTYNAFNKPLTVKIGSTVVDAFSYGADLMRYRHQKDSGKVAWYLDKYLEIVNLGSTWDYRHYLGDVAILTKTGSLNDPSPSIDFIHRDRLGNVAKLTNAAGGNPSGTSPSGRGFDPYGKPRNEDWSDRAAPPTGATLDRSQTERGFTDHEHLDQAELIHMNGRAFDYNLGRFLSVDPFIQAPGNSQALNPYSYIMNNPLAGTDPSGYFCKGTRIGSEGGSVCGEPTYYLATSFVINHESSQGVGPNEASGSVGIWAIDDNGRNTGVGTSRNGNSPNNSDGSGPKVGEFKQDGKISPDDWIRKRDGGGYQGSSDARVIPEPTEHWPGGEDQDDPGGLFESLPKGQRDQIFDDFYSRRLEWIRNGERSIIPDLPSLGDLVGLARMGKMAEAMALVEEAGEYYSWSSSQFNYASGLLSLVDHRAVPGRNTLFASRYLKWAMVKWRYYDYKKEAEAAVDFYMYINGEDRPSKCFYREMCQ
jgi:RHS repeat-associated protein